MTVFLRPDADSADGNWLNESGSATNLFASLDEVAPGSDTDFIKSGASPSNDICKVRLSNPGGSFVTSGTLSYTYWKTGTANMDVRVRLLQGAVEIAKWDHTNIGLTPTTVDQTLSGPEFSSITDFDDLWVEMIANPVDFVGLLDTVSDLGPVFSFRRLLLAYEGNCCRIRRSSNDDEQDFGFDADGVVDTAAIASFVGGGSGYVVTWYDQNGNVADVTNSDHATQPLFVASSTINSLPAMRIDETNGEFLQTSGNSVDRAEFTGTDAFTAFLVADMAIPGATSIPWTWTDNVVSLIGVVGTVTSFSFYWSVTDVLTDATTNAFGAPKVIETVRRPNATDTYEIFLDGTSAEGPTAVTSDYSTEDCDLYIGGLPGSGSMDGDLCEVIFIKADPGSTIRQDIRKDGIGGADSIGTYYGITVS